MADDVTNVLNEVIEVLRGGAGFYRDGADKVHDPELAALFRENAEKREAAAEELGAHVAAEGGAPASGGWAEQAASWYARMKAVFSDTEETMIVDLEEHEDRTLDQLRGAKGRLPEDSVEAEMIDRHLATFKETHERMRARKKAV